MSFRKFSDVVEKLKISVSRCGPTSHITNTRRPSSVGLLPSKINNLANSFSRQTLSKPSTVGDTSSTSANFGEIARGYESTSQTVNRPRPTTAGISPEEICYIANSFSQQTLSKQHQTSDGGSSKTFKPRYTPVSPDNRYQIPILKKTYVSTDLNKAHQYNLEKTITNAYLYQLYSNNNQTVSARKSSSKDLGMYFESSASVKKNLEPYNSSESVLSAVEVDSIEKLPSPQIFIKAINSPKSLYTYKKDYSKFVRQMNLNTYSKQLRFKFNLNSRPSKKKSSLSRNLGLIKDKSETPPSRDDLIIWPTLYRYKGPASTGTNQPHRFVYSSTKQKHKVKSTKQKHKVKKNKFCQYTMTAPNKFHKGSNTFARITSQEVEQLIADDNNVAPTPVASIKKECSLNKNLLKINKKAEIESKKNTEAEPENINRPKNETPEIDNELNNTSSAVLKKTPKKSLVKKLTDGMKETSIWSYKNEIPTLNKVAILKTEISQKKQTLKKVETVKDFSKLFSDIVRDPNVKHIRSYSTTTRKSSSQKLKNSFLANSKLQYKSSRDFTIFPFQQKSFDSFSNKSTKTIFTAFVELLKNFSKSRFKSFEEFELHQSYFDKYKRWPSSYGSTVMPDVNFEPKFDKHIVTNRYNPIIDENCFNFKNYEPTASLNDTEENRYKFDRNTEDVIKSLKPFSTDEEQLVSKFIENRKKLMNNEQRLKCSSLMFQCEKALLNRDKKKIKKPSPNRNFNDTVERPPYKNNNDTRPPRRSVSYEPLYTCKHKTHINALKSNYKKMKTNKKNLYNFYDANTSNTNKGSTFVPFNRFTTKSKSKIIDSSEFKYLSGNCKNLINQKPLNRDFRNVSLDYYTENPRKMVYNNEIQSLNTRLGLSFNTNVNNIKLSHSNPCIPQGLSLNRNNELIQAKSEKNNKKQIGDNLEYGTFDKNGIKLKSQENNEKTKRMYLKNEPVKSFDRTMIKNTKFDTLKVKYKSFSDNFILMKRNYIKGGTSVGKTSGTKIGTVKAKRKLKETNVSKQNANKSEGKMKDTSEIKSKMNDSNKTESNMKGTNKTELEIKDTNKTEREMKDTSEIKSKMNDSNKTESNMKGTNKTELEIKDTNKTEREMKDTSKTNSKIKESSISKKNSNNEVKIPYIFYDFKKKNLSKSEITAKTAKSSEHNKKKTFKTKNNELLNGLTKEIKYSLTGAAVKEKVDPKHFEKNPFFFEPNKFKTKKKPDGIFIERKPTKLKVSLPPLHSASSDKFYKSKTSFPLTRTEVHPDLAILLKAGADEASNVVAEVNSNNERADVNDLIVEREKIFAEHEFETIDQFENFDDYKAEELDDNLEVSAPEEDNVFFGNSPPPTMKYVPAFNSNQESRIDDIDEEDNNNSILSNVSPILSKITNKKNVFQPVELNEKYDFNLNQQSSSIKHIPFIPTEAEDHTTSLHTNEELHDVHFEDESKSFSTSVDPYLPTPSADGVDNDVKPISTVDGKSYRNIFATKQEVVTEKIDLNNNKHSIKEIVEAKKINIPLECERSWYTEEQAMKIKKIPPRNSVKSVDL